jgi:hypothetical protein
MGKSGGRLSANQERLFPSREHSQDFCVNSFSTGYRLKFKWFLQKTQEGYLFYFILNLSVIFFHLKFQIIKL